MGRERFDPLTDEQAALAAGHYRIARWFARRAGPAYRRDPDEVVSRFHRALVNAARTYSPDRGSFSNWIKQYCASELASLRQINRPRGYRHAHQAAAFGFVTLQEDLDSAATPFPDFDAVDAADEVDALADAAGLTDAARGLLRARFGEGKTYPEIAAEMGIKAKATEQRVRTAVHKLRRAAPYLR